MSQSRPGGSVELSGHSKNLVRDTEQKGEGGCTYGPGVPPSGEYAYHSTLNNKRKININNNGQGKNQKNSHKNSRGERPKRSSAQRFFPPRVPDKDTSNCLQDICKCLSGCFCCCTKRPEVNESYSDNAESGADYKRMES
jgi:hypothetical protein